MLRDNIKAYTNDNFTSFLKLSVGEHKTVSQAVSLKEHFLLLRVCVYEYIHVPCDSYLQSFPPSMLG